jgi:hypothetical protein
LRSVERAFVVAPAPDLLAHGRGVALRAAGEDQISEIELVAPTGSHHSGVFPGLYQADVFPPLGFSGMATTGRAA